MNEIWKDIKDYEGLYKISNKGNVKSLDRIILYKNGKRRFFESQQISLVNTHGYSTVSLNKNGNGKRFYLHRLLALSYLPLVKGKNDINHINGIKDDNRLENIEWCTQSENVQHAYDNDLNKNAREIYLTNVAGLKYAFPNLKNASLWLGKNKAYVSLMVTKGYKYLKDDKGNLYNYDLQWSDNKEEEE